MAVFFSGVSQVNGMYGTRMFAIVWFCIGTDIEHVNGNRFIDNDIYAYGTWLNSLHAERL